MTEVIGQAGRSGSSVYYRGYGWAGTLTDRMDETALYTRSYVGTLLLSGTVPDVSTYVFRDREWTWIGVPLKNGQIPIASFLPGAWGNGDVLVSQDSISTHDGSSWVGGVPLSPCREKGKVFKNGGTFLHTP